MGHGLGYCKAEDDVGYIKGRILGESGPNITKKPMTYFCDGYVIFGVNSPGSKQTRMDMPLALSDQKQPSSVLAIQATVLVFNLVSSILIITVSEQVHLQLLPVPSRPHLRPLRLLLARHRAAAVLRCV